MNGTSDTDADVVSQADAWTEDDLLRAFRAAVSRVRDQDSPYRNEQVSPAFAALYERALIDMFNTHNLLYQYTIFSQSIEDAGSDLMSTDLNENESVIRVMTERPTRWTTSADLVSKWDKQDIRDKPLRDAAKRILREHGRRLD